MRKPFSILMRTGLFCLVVLQASTPSQAVIVDVTLSASAITPDTVVIAPGDTVRWTVVTGTHQLHSDTDSFKSWDSGLLDTPGQIFDLPFRYADGMGPFHYRCLQHARQGAVLVADTCWATGTLNESGPPTVADVILALRIIGGYLPAPDILYRLDLTGDCIVNYADAQALSDWFELGPGSLPLYPVPTCCFPVLGPSACAIALPGDLNQSGSVSSADLIYLIHYIFKGGNAPGPCAAAGDLDCSGHVSAADVIYLINFIFKSGPIPCDDCALIPDVWTCP